jgi:hypothetical protein
MMMGWEEVVGVFMKVSRYLAGGTDKKKSEKTCYQSQFPGLDTNLGSTECKVLTAHLNVQCVESPGEVSVGRNYIILCCNWDTSLSPRSDKKSHETAKFV